ncbi:hypothetical protein ACFQ4J_12405 [Laceyella tengchongensis]
MNIKDLRHFSAMALIFFLIACFFPITVLAEGYKAPDPYKAPDIYQAPDPYKARDDIYITPDPYQAPDLDSANSQGNGKGDSASNQEKRPWYKKLWDKGKGIVHTTSEGLNKAWEWTKKNKEYIISGLVLAAGVACLFIPGLQGVGVSILIGWATSFGFSLALNGGKVDKHTFMEAAIGGVLGIVSLGLAGGITKGLASAFGQKAVTALAGSRIFGPVLNGAGKLIGKMPGPIQKVFSKMGLVSVVEGAGTSVVDDLLHGKKIDWKKATLSGLAGAALVGGVSFVTPYAKPLVDKTASAFQDVTSPVVAKVSPFLKKLNPCLGYQQSPIPFASIAIMKKDGCDVSDLLAGNSDNVADSSKGHTSKPVEIKNKEIKEAFAGLKDEQIRQIVKSPEAEKGLQRLVELSGNTKFATNIKKAIEDDDAVAKYIGDDLEKLGSMNDKAVNEMNQRLDTIRKRIENDFNEDLIDIALDTMNNSPETYFSFARANYFEKSGPKPNAVTKHLLEQGYTNQDLKKVAKLVHTPTLAYSPEERVFMEKVRLSLPAPKKAFKVITDFHKSNYLKKDNPWNTIVGFWGDANFYGGQSRETFIYDHLRLDYPGTNHFAKDSKQTWAMEFAPPETIDKKDIPFMFDVPNDIDDMKDMWKFSNLPSNPFSGSGFLTARDGSLIPEFELKNAIPLKKGTRIGYFNEKGKYIPKYQYDGDKWVDLD